MSTHNICFPGEIREVCRLYWMTSLICSFTVYVHAIMHICFMPTVYARFEVVCSSTFPPERVLTICTSPKTESQES